MSQLRILLFSSLLAGVLFLAGAFLPSFPTLGCLLADEGCGYASNQCKANCIGVNCIRSSNPFEYCECNGAASTCMTVGCEM